MPHKSPGSDMARLPGIASTTKLKQKVFGVTQQELEEILATTRWLMKEYLNIKLATKDQVHQCTKVENAVKGKYPKIFGSDENSTKIRHLRSYISIRHSNSRSDYKKLEKGKGMGEVVRQGRRTEVCGLLGGSENGGGGMTTTGEGAGPFSASRHMNSPTNLQARPHDTPMQSGGVQAPLPPDSVGPTTTQPPTKRGRPPKRNGHSSAASWGASSGDSASADTSPALTTQSTNAEVEIVSQPKQNAVAPAQLLAPPPQFFPPNDHVEMEITPSQDSDTGLKEVSQFLRTCKPSLIHLLDHLAYYGCVNGHFLEYLAGRAERLAEEAFHGYLRNHFSKGHLEGQKDLTEMEVLVLTEGLLRLRGG